MNVIEVNEGPKISYNVMMKTWIILNDELMLNLEKYERDYEHTIDICENEVFSLGMGLGRKYVAQIVIPAREYREIEQEDVEQQTEDGEETGKSTTYEPVPFDINKVTLKLWRYEK